MYCASANLSGVKHNKDTEWIATKDSMRQAFVEFEAWQIRTTHLVLLSIADTLCRYSVFLKRNNNQHQDNLVVETNKLKTIHCVLSAMLLLSKYDLI